MPSGTGQASYENVSDPKYKEPCLVPLYIATEANTQEYGRIVRNFEEEELWITTWPQQGWRPICEGTGNLAGVKSYKFTCWWDDDMALARTEGKEKFSVGGRLPPEVSPTNRTYVLAREANYHPDGGQVFYPLNKNAFILVLALPGDDVKLEDFVGFYFDGSFGFQIKAAIWHQFLYTVDEKGEFASKEGKVHACVLMDSVDEFGKFMKIPLKPELATQ